MATVRLESAVNSHKPDPLHAATEEAPINDDEDPGGQFSSTEL